MNEQLLKLNLVLEDIQKPKHFCDYRHCEECKEHDDTLRHSTRETISLDALGNPGWDPICFINTKQGFAYYLPALARLAIGKGNNYYLDTFLFHLNSERLKGLSSEVKLVLKDFLLKLQLEMPDEIENNFDTKNIQDKISELES